MNLKPIKNCKDYFISDCGKVFSDKLRKRAQLKPWFHDGYERVGIRKIPNGKKTQFRIHQLVAIHFIPNPNNFETVNHIDGVRNNNKVLNLEWATVAAQNEHRDKLAQIKEHIKEHEYYNGIGEISDEDYQKAVKELLEN